MQYQKVHSVAKVVTPKGSPLSKKILSTMKTISDIVGATLGPGGMPILIERQESGLPGMVTKDGVTVFRSLGFHDSVSHSVMEAARDAAVRTVTEAGDGTTTATVLAEAIVRYTNEFIAANPTMSSQKVVRKLEEVFATHIEPTIREHSVGREDLAGNEEAWDRILWGVAKVSANGDDKLADAVLECFRLVGDEGNVTIMEMSGPSGYAVERIKGFPIGQGFEDSCARFMNEFVNDAANQRVLLDKPSFVLYHGAITDATALTHFLLRYASAYGGEDPNYYGPKLSPNVVLVATGFSESVLAWLALNFKASGSINVVPLLCPKTPLKNSEYHFLGDLAAITGSQILDPINAPFDQPDKSPLSVMGSSDSFEMYRYRSNVIGRRDEDELLDWAEQVKGQIDSAESQLDRMLLQERYGKLTGGIAKLMVTGASNGELKEKRDRAEDAVCAVRGAIKHGTLPAGGWTLLKLVDILTASRMKECLKTTTEPAVWWKFWEKPKIVSTVESDVVLDILVPALFEPVYRLLYNVGLNSRETGTVINRIMNYASLDESVVYDAMEGKFVDAYETGLLDSTPAVLEAIRNSISIASLIGTLGGVVAFGRDTELERRESESTAEFLRNAGVNEADQRW